MVGRESPGIFTMAISEFPRKAPDQPCWLEAVHLRHRDVYEDDIEMDALVRILSHGDEGFESIERRANRI